MAWFPWEIGTYFKQQGHTGYAALVESVLTKLLEVPINPEIDASPMIEVNHHAARDDSFEWVNKLIFHLNNDGSITFTIPQLDEWGIVLLQ